jgi:hypothetical protein
MFPPSVLVKDQKRRYGPREYTEGRDTLRITATVRHDDQCGNGHNTFSVTADIECKNEFGRWREYGGGCCHEEIAKHFPELAPVIKWHLTSTDGPMHYIANTVYHAEQHGPTHAWVTYTVPVPADPLNIFEEHKRELMGYIKAEKAKAAEGVAGYVVKWDEKTVKVRNLDYARSSAVWPDATDEQLTADKATLTAALTARLPALMAEFKAAVESLGLVY